MIAPIANIFGYVLNFLYEIIKNYGIAMIVFSILIKIALLPISIKQQRTVAKSSKIQKKLKEIQERYKNDQERVTKETLNLYKEEKMSPFSGCFSAIIQILILLAMFYLVRSPLTHMKKIDAQVIEGYVAEIKETEEYQKNMSYPEIAVIKEKGGQDEAVYINMEFLGLDLSAIPKDDLTDFRVLVIPILYVVSSAFSMYLTNKMQKKNMENAGGEMQAMQNMNRNMMFLMPVMSVMISMVAPLGLALYWLTNNVLMIVERILINRYSVEEES